MSFNVSHIANEKLSVQLTGNNIIKTLGATALDVSQYECGFINVTLGWGTGHLEGSYDSGVSYVRIAVQNVQTGTSFQRIDMRGQYFADLRGLTHLKYIVDYTAAGTGEHSAKVSLLATFNQPKPSVQRKTNKKYAPSTPSVMGKLTPTSPGRQITDLDLKNGVVYAYSGPTISKSADYGTVWTNVINAGQPWGTASFSNGSVKKLPNGKILAILHNGANTEIYLSDAVEANFALVYSFPVEGVVSPGFGLHVYGDIILLAPYKPQTRLAANPLRIHLSKDGGVTWAVIHTSPAIDTWHYHDVVFDPYRQRIWAVTGDQHNLANVYFSDDFGTTWATLWTEANVAGKAPTQFTTVHPMPDVVIFGTDQVGFQGAYKYYRQDGNHIFEPCYSRKTPGSVGDATYRGHQLWEAGAIYIASKNPTCIFATKDGENFYLVWSTSDTTASINTVLGVDKNNKMVAIGSVGTTGNALIFDAPTWFEI